jgi:hypothetical protein
MEFGKLKLNSTHLVMLVAAAVLAYALYNYSSQKGLSLSGMADGSHTEKSNENKAEGSYSDCQGMGANFSAANPEGSNSGPAEVSNMPGTTSEQPKQQDPSHLLPSDSNSEWSSLNPSGNGNASNVNLLKAGYHIGRDTVLGTLRNANLQVRSEPANPQSTVGPWNNTTIGPDNNRRPLEIGCGPM